MTVFVVVASIIGISFIFIGFAGAAGIAEDAESYEETRRDEVMDFLHTNHFNIDKEINIAEKITLY